LGQGGQGHPRGEQGGQQKGLFHNIFNHIGRFLWLPHSITRTAGLGQAKTRREKTPNPML
jgi:hypothetical protein